MTRYTEWPKNQPRSGRPYSGGKPKVVIHTTEGTHLPSYPWPPHITYDIDNDRGWRHVPFNQGAFALRSPGGGQSPNYQGGFAFQIEVISFAGDSPDKPDWWYKRLGTLIADICEDWGVPPQLHPKGFTGSQAYGRNGVNRISWKDYQAFSGILGHQHVPFNTHWDPGNIHEGKLNIAILEAYMAIYRTVKNVPEKSGQPKDWVKDTIDDGIRVGAINIDDKNPEDWEKPVTYGVLWTILDRMGWPKGSTK